MAETTELPPPEAPVRLYDREDIDPLDFMLAVMRDKRLPITVRIDAANKSAQFKHARLAQLTRENADVVKVYISGGLPPLPGTDIIMPPAYEMMAKDITPPKDITP